MGKRQSFTITVDAEASFTITVDAEASLDDFDIDAIEAYLAENGKATSTTSVDVEIGRAWRALAEGDIEYAADCLRRIYPYLPPFATEQRLVAGLGRAKENAHAHAQ